MKTPLALRANEVNRESGDFNCPKEELRLKQAHVCKHRGNGTFYPSSH